MDEERCVDNCAGKLIRSNHRLMATYVQLMPRMVQRRMEELESKAAENARLEAEAAASTSVGPELQSTPVATSVISTEASQNLQELNTNEVGLLSPTPLLPSTESNFNSGTSIAADFAGVQNIESAPHAPPKTAFLPEDVSISISAPQKSTEHQAGAERDSNVD